MAAHIFREYDIRGVFGKDLSEGLIRAIGLHFGREVAERQGAMAPVVTLGVDARTHSPILAAWITEGLGMAGVTVADIGMVPTPVSYFSQFHGDPRPEATIMITGSHNPPEYNGFKINLGGNPYFGEQIQDLRKRIEEAGALPGAPGHPDRKGRAGRDTLSAYIEYHVDRFSSLAEMNRRLGTPLRVAVDSGNGVAALAAVPILRRLGCTVEELYSEPDGTFPNHHPDPAEEKNLADLKKLLASGKFDLGVAYDGDGDRIGPITPSGRVVIGDELLILFTRELIEAGVRRPVVIGEVKCSQVMYDLLGAMGAEVHMYKTGHSKIKTRMKELGAHLAGEVSGHIFFKEGYLGFDDAIHATLRLLEIIARKKAADPPYTLDDDLATLPKSYATPEIKVPVPEERKFEIVERFKEALADPPAGFPQILDRTEIDGVRFRFPDGWGLVRPSNTTPVLVLRFEASSLTVARNYETRVREILSGIVGN